MFELWVLFKGMFVIINIIKLCLVFFQVIVNTFSTALNI